jgi:hypothetical protein
MALVVGGGAVCLRLPRVYHKHTFLLFSCVFACAPSRSSPAAAAAASVPAAHARRAMQIFILRHRWLAVGVGQIPIPRTHL